MVKISFKKEKDLQRVLLEILPILIMILLIPFIVNDFVLTGLYIIIIAGALIYKYERGDQVVLVLGFVAMIFAEYFFITTGVETFQRRTLLDVMPFWLPFLWSYGFVVIKRIIRILK